MLGQIKALIGLELSNLFGLNVLRYTKDPKVKRKAVLMAVLYGIVMLFLASYVSAMSFGIIMLGAADVVPAYLIVVSGLLVFFLGAFSAKASVFRTEGYDILCSLPIPSWMIVLSRFVRLYAQSLAVTLVTMAPALVGYGIRSRGGAGFWLSAAIGVLAAPLLPTAAAALFGAVVAVVSSRAKHKSLVEALLCLLFILGTMALTPQMEALEGELTPEMLSAVVAKLPQLLGKLYPPAILLGDAIAQGRIGEAFTCAAAFAVAFAAVVLAVTCCFHAVCRRLQTTAAAHNYRMKELRQTSVLFALCRREWKRYLSSGVYLTNTIIGPVLGTALAVSIWLGGHEQLMVSLPLPVDLTGLLPFLVGAMFCTMPPSAVSVSMEGRQWWIAKSLPLSEKTILDAKLLMNLTLDAPFYLVSEVLLITALRPGFAQLVWLVVIPAALILFACVFGLAVNLRLPLLQWDSEAAVVKQSASALLGGLGGLVVAVLGAVLVLVVPQSCANTAKGLYTAALVLLTAALYRHNNRVDLTTL